MRFHPTLLLVCVATIVAPLEQVNGAVSEIEAFHVVSQLTRVAREHQAVVQEKVLNRMLQQTNGTDPLAEIFDTLSEFLAPECISLANETLFTLALNGTVPSELSANLTSCVTDAVLGPFNQCLSRWPAIGAPFRCVLQYVSNTLEDFGEESGGSSDEDASANTGLQEDSAAASLKGPLVLQNLPLNSTQCLDIFGTGPDQFKPLACLYVVDPEGISKEIESFSKASDENFAGIPECSLLVNTETSIEESTGASSERRLQASPGEGSDGSDPSLFGNPDLPADFFKKPVETCDAENNLGVVEAVNDFEFEFVDSPASVSQFLSALLGFSVIVTLLNI